MSDPNSRPSDPSWFERFRQSGTNPRLQSEGLVRDFNNKIWFETVRRSGIPDPENQVRGLITAFNNDNRRRDPAPETTPNEDLSAHRSSQLSSSGNPVLTGSITSTRPQRSCYKDAGTILTKFREMIPSLATSRAFATLTYETLGDIYDRTGISVEERERLLFEAGVPTGSVGDPLAAFIAALSATFTVVRESLRHE